MFKNPMLEKLIETIRHARYPFAKGQLFVVDEDNSLCACALGQVALMTNLISEEDARNDSNPEWVYDKLRDRFGEGIVNQIPPINDALELESGGDTATGQESVAIFEKLATKIAAEAVQYDKEPVNV